MCSNSRYVGFPGRWIEGDKERGFREALRGVVVAIYIVVVPYLEMVRTEGAELTLSPRTSRLTDAFSSNFLFSLNHSQSQQVIS